MGDELETSRTQIKVSLLIKVFQKIKSIFKDKLFPKIKTFFAEILPRAAKFVFRKKPLTLVLAFICVISLSLAAYFFYTKGRIMPHVYISGISVGTLTQAEAQTKLEHAAAAALQQNLTLSTRTGTIKIPLKDLGLSLRFDEALATAYAIGHSGNVWERATAKVLAPIKVHDVSLSPTWDDKTLTTALEKTLRLYDHAVKDASFSITSDHLMEITPDETGFQADIPALAEQVRRFDPFNPKSLTVPYREILPSVTAAQLEQQKITGMLASFTTKFDPNLRGRTENIRLASRALDGTLLKPGEEFSFNGTVGPRTAASGYKEAVITENGRFVPGLGGGVCQVSSTLYNVVLTAGLVVSERHPHALPVNYVPPGKDATIAWGSLNFKFKNNSDGYALIKSSVGPDSITIDIYGKT